MRKYMLGIVLLSVAAIAFAGLLLGGCSVSKERPPLRDRLYEIQYNSYKPLLDHVTEKYGDIFKMDNYGTITPVDGHFVVLVGYNAAQELCDNYQIYLNRDAIEEAMQSLVYASFPNSKVYLTKPYGRSTLPADTDVEVFLSSNLTGYDLYFPYVDLDTCWRDADTLAALLTRNNYAVEFRIFFVSEDVLPQITEDPIYSDLRDTYTYQYRINALYTKNHNYNLSGRAPN